MSATAQRERREVNDRPRLPMEFRGLARAFRGGVRLEEVRFDQVLASIVLPLKRRLAHHPKLRHEQAAQAERLYRSVVPSRFRLSEVEVIRDRSKFSIREARLTATWMKSSDWQDDTDEIGIAVCTFELSLSNRRLSATWRPHGVASLHCLGRWFQRSGRRDHALLIRDLAVLLHAGEAGEVRNGDTVPTADGTWCGSVADLKGEGSTYRCRAVRTWFSQDQRE
jgi:hypothetical protein